MIALIILIGKIAAIAVMVILMVSGVLAPLYQEYMEENGLIKLP